MPHTLLKNFAKNVQTCKNEGRERGNKEQKLPQESLTEHVPGEDVGHTDKAPGAV